MGQRAEALSECGIINWLAPMPVDLRLLVGDDPHQAKAARLLFAKEDVWISFTVLLETEWVLRGAYHLPTETIQKALAKLLGLENVHVESPAVAASALAGYRQGADFADALHLAAALKTDGFATFDRKIQKNARRLDQFVPILPL